MNWEFTSQGLFHKFKASQNQLIVECYDYEGFHVGTIKMIIGEQEREELIETIGKLK